MATEFTGGGDPRRSISLPWGLPGARRRGPKPRHSVDEVVQAAIALADAEGLAALSIRRVAETLGLSAMSLYTYVPSKAELVDLMLDRVAGEDEPSSFAVHVAQPRRRRDDVLEPTRFDSRRHGSSPRPSWPCLACATDEVPDASTLINVDNVDRSAIMDS